MIHRFQEGKITGFACTPVSTEIDTPEYDLFEGGLHCSYVHIRPNAFRRRQVGVSNSYFRNKGVDLRIGQLLGLPKILCIHLRCRGDWMEPVTVLSLICNLIA